MSNPKKMGFSPKGQNLTFESQFIANYKKVSIYSFAVLDTTNIKL